MRIEVVDFAAVRCRKEDCQIRIRRHVREIGSRIESVSLIDKIFPLTHIAGEQIQYDVRQGEGRVEQEHHLG